MIVTILWLICFNVILLYMFLVWTFDYWNKRRVNGPKPRPFLGNFPSVFTQNCHIAGDIQQIYEAYKRTDNYVGIFNCRTPLLMITDVGLIRRILVTDFKHFHDNEASTMVDEKSDFVIANNPFGLTGDDWKERRAEITPGLATLRIKAGFSVTTKICKNLVHYIERQQKLCPKDGINGLDLSLRFTCEAVTDFVLGQKADTFSQKPTPVLSNAQKLSEQSFITIIYMTLVGLVPALKKYKKLHFVPKTVEKYFMNLVRNTFEWRKKNSVNRNRTDFLNYLLQLQEKKRLRERELTAHALTVLLDGYVTTSELMAHCLLMLARDLSRQQILRTEVMEKMGDKSDFDIISDLKYLDACVHETLRIFPPTTFMMKICTIPIDLMNKKGETLKVAVGTPVMLPIHAVQNDAEHYPNPRSFEPERFLNGGLKKFKDKGVYLAFSDGPRVCLGMRFALTQVKAALVEIIRNYEVRINPKTRSDNRFNPTNLLSQLDGGIWLEFHKNK